MVFSFLLSPLLGFQILPPPPNDYSHRVDFSGSILNNQGLVAYQGLDPSAVNFGHSGGAKNAVNIGSPYYVTGREGSPEIPSPGATRSADVTGLNNFPFLSQYLENNNIPLNSIGFGLKQKEGRSFEQTWNLGNNILGEDWYASPDSTIEENIYKANPDDVEWGLYYNQTKIVDFGYTDIYVAVDFGPTTSFLDDTSFNFTNPVPATKSVGLDQLQGGLADAFLQDVKNAGGKVRVSSSAPVTLETVRLAISDKYAMRVFSFAGSIQAVKAVPEPSSQLGIFAFGVLGAAFWLRKKHKIASCKKRTLTLKN
ncbi:PEP-CTERM sorting domain-containing protein [Tolypothrix sp. VBCCA 56010]|uniref:PEP-CTERM sorting domain-containing protein n=1 Tax=Tolypothrix sp. VBCCA 56010 TaxID=3137731 RepID=UPI003D7D83B3